MRRRDAEFGFRVRHSPGTRQSRGIAQNRRNRSPICKMVVVPLSLGTSWISQLALAHCAEPDSARLRRFWLAGAHDAHARPHGAGILGAPGGHGAVAASGLGAVKSVVSNTEDLGGRKPVTVTGSHADA